MRIGRRLLSPRPTLDGVLECVINVSEGRDMVRLRTIARACGPSLVDVHADPDHHRSVFTLAGPGPRDAVAGARRRLVACTCVLVSRDISVARRIAREMRERSGGLRGVRALGFFLPEARRAQVSMNLVDLEQTGVQDGCLHVRALAQRYGTDVASVELVGLIPRRDLDRCTDDFLQWSRLDAEST